MSAINFYSIDENPDSFAMRARHAFQRHWEALVVADRFKPRPVTQSEEVQVSAATVGRREHSFTYPPEMFGLWSDRKRDVVIFRGEK